MKKLFFYTIFISLIAMCFSACSKEEQTGKKISIRENSANPLSILYQGVIREAEAENRNGSVFIKGQYKMENGFRSDIDVIVPKSKAVNLSVGDTLYFTRTSVSSNRLADNDPVSTYMGIFCAADTTDILFLYGVEHLNRL